MHGVSRHALIAKMAEGREGKTFFPTGVAEVVNFESDEGFTNVAFASYRDNQSQQCGK